MLANLDNEVHFKKVFTDIAVFCAFVKDVLGIDMNISKVEAEKVQKTTYFDAHSLPSLVEVIFIEYVPRGTPVSSNVKVKRWRLWCDFKVKVQRTEILRCAAPTKKVAFIYDYLLNSLFRIFSPINRQSEARYQVPNAVPRGYECHTA